MLFTNRNASSLQALRKRATLDNLGDFLLANGLLLFKNRLFIPNIDNIRILLIREAHDQVSSAHPSARKTFLLLSKQYY